MIVCTTLLRELSNYLDGDVDLTLREELEAHWKMCRRCWVLVDSSRKMRRLLARTPIFELPAGLGARLHARWIQGPERPPAHP